MIHPPSIRAAPAPWVIAPVPRSTVAHAQCITKSKGASWSPPTVACPGRCALQSVLAPTGRSLIHPAGVAEIWPTSVGSWVTQVIIASHAGRRHAGCCETRSIGNDSVVCIAIHIASRESKGHRVGRRAHDANKGHPVHRRTRRHHIHQLRDGIAQRPRSGGGVGSEPRCILTEVVRALTENQRRTGVGCPTQTRSINGHKSRRTTDRGERCLCLRSIQRRYMRHRLLIDRVIGCRCSGHCCQDIAPCALWINRCKRCRKG